jgi:hypothetical protein
VGAEVVSGYPRISCDVCHVVAPVWRFDLPAGTLVFSVMDPATGKTMELRSMGEGFGLCAACDKLRTHPLAARKMARARLRFPPLRERLGQSLGDALRVLEGTMSRLNGLLSNRRAYVAGENATDGACHWLSPAPESN